MFAYRILDDIEEIHLRVMYIVTVAAEREYPHYSQMSLIVCLLFNVVTCKLRHHFLCYLGAWHSHHQHKVLFRGVLLNEVEVHVPNIFGQLNFTIAHLLDFGSMQGWNLK